MSSAEQSRAVVVPFSPAPDALVRELSASTRIDALEAWFSRFPQNEPPVVHRFWEGMYIREFHAPAGEFFTSRIHRTEHPFIVSKGSVTVWSTVAGLNRFSAPYSGITKPGTRRVLFTHEDLVWTTFHVTDKTTIAEVEKDLFMDYEHGKNYCLSEAEIAGFDSLFERLCEEFSASKVLAAGQKALQNSEKPMNLNFNEGGSK